MSIIIVAYKPEMKKLMSVQTLIAKDLKVILVNNSENLDLNKVKFDNNVTIINSKNNGNGAAINLALEKITTKYAMYLDIDVEFQKDFIEKISYQANTIGKFGVLVPDHGNLESKNLKIEKYEGEASVMLFNLDTFKKKNLFDEAYFLYFEEQDLFQYCKKKNIKVFFLSGLQIKHHRASSVSYEEKNLSYLRSWHYTWSMFFYYKKNFNYWKAVKKTFLILFSDLFMIIFFLISFNIKSLKIRFFRVFGLASSIVGLKSFLRP